MVPSLLWVISHQKVASDITANKIKMHENKPVHVESPSGETEKASNRASFQCWQAQHSWCHTQGSCAGTGWISGFVSRSWGGFRKNTGWEMQLPALDITTPTVCAHSISCGSPLPLRCGSPSATAPSSHLPCFWGSVWELSAFSWAVPSCRFNHEQQRN